MRIICDSRLRIPLEAQIVATAEQVPTILAVCEKGYDNLEKRRALEAAGCRILCVKETNGHLDLRQLMQKLGKEQVDSILLEGGGTLNWAALESGIVCKVQAYMAPKLFGGRDAKTPVEGTGVSSPSEAVILKNSVVTSLGEDYLIESEVAADVHRDC